MSSTKDGTNVPTPSSSPVDSAPPAGSPPGEPPLPDRSGHPLNVFDADFLARLEDRDEPPAAEAAEWAGPWRLDKTRDGGLELYRLGESAGRGHRPFGRFQHQSDGLLAMAIIASRREAAYRLSPQPDGPGYAGSPVVLPGGLRQGHPGARGQHSRRAGGLGHPLSLTPRLTGCRLRCFPGRKPLPGVFYHHPERDCPTTTNRVRPASSGSPYGRRSGTLRPDAGRRLYISDWLRARGPRILRSARVHGRIPEHWLWQSRSCA